MVLFFYLVIVQLCYFVLESMRIVLHSQDLFELILRVNSTFLCCWVKLFVFRKYFGVLLCITDLVSDLLALFSGGGFNISPMKPRNGRPRAQVQHLMQIDLKGWGVGYISSFQQHCLLQMLNCVAGKNLWFIVVGWHHLGFSIGVLLVCWQVLNDLI